MSEIEKRIKEMKAPNDGDDYLSPFDHKLWAIVYHVLLKYGCPIYFKKLGPDCPKKFDLYVEFFVPRQHEKCEEVCDFLAIEFESEVRSGKTLVDGSYMFGTQIIIFKFNGPDTYLERENLEKMCQGFYETLKRKFTNGK